MNTPKSLRIETPCASSVSIHSCENGGGILKGIADRLGRKEDWKGEEEGRKIESVTTFDGEGKNRRR